MAYHRLRGICCILAGETEGGGLLMVAPVSGFTIGMARPRVAAGWCNLRLDCWLWNAGGMKEGEAELREKAGGATVWGCCVGEDSGEPLASEERSEALWMETSFWDQLVGLEDREEIDPLQSLTSLSVNRPGQNSMSSSRSKDRVASNRVRKVISAVESESSLRLRTVRYCLLAFCDMESRGALRFLPWWF